MLWRCIAAVGAALAIFPSMAQVADAPVKIGVEAAVRQGWDAIIGNDGIFVGMSSFGASAPFKELYKKFGITAEAIAQAASSKLGKK